MMDAKMGFVVNYKLALESPEFSSLTKSTIKRVMESTYLPLATWIKTISSPDLDYIIGILEKMHKSEDTIEAMTDVILLNEVLCAGDGFVSDGMETSINSFNYLAFVCSCEYLKRKGHVSVDYSKISYGSEAQRGEICTLLK